MGCGSSKSDTSRQLYREYYKDQETVSSVLTQDEHSVRGQPEGHEADGENRVKEMCTQTMTNVKSSQVAYTDYNTSSTITESSSGNSYSEVFDSLSRDELNSSRR